MNKKLEQLATEEVTTQRDWSVDGVPVLSAKLCLPKPLGDAGRAGRRIDGYYRALQRAYLRYCERWLFPQAAEAYRQACQNSTSLPHDTASLTHRITWNSNGFWSLYTQSRECVSGHTELLRRGDTWDLESGYPLSLSAFFPRQSGSWRKRLRERAAAEILRQEALGTACYHDAWRQELRRFNSENFYLTAEGLCFFYQMYAIGPAAEGIPTFCLPYGDEGPILPRGPVPTVTAPT